MSTLQILMFSLLVAFVSIPLTSSADPSEVAPTPPPENGADAPSPASSNISSPEPSPSTSPSPSPSLNSPPAPPPSDLSPDTSPAPSPTEENSPAPAPADESDINHGTTSGNIEASSSSNGMSGGQKAGIAIGVIAGACVVGLGAVVYKKRQQNVRRSEFGYAARRDFL